MTGPARLTDAPRRSQAGSALCCLVLLMTFALHPSAAYPQATGTASFRIAGRVVNAESGSPLANAGVALLTVVNGVRQDLGQDANQDQELSRQGRGRGAPGGRRRPARTAAQATTTNEDGGFVFDHVPAGKYSLEASHRGFVTASYQEHGAYSTAIVAGDGLPSEGLVLQLSPGAAIGGAVIDTAGDTIEGGSVTLYRVADDGLGSIRTYQVTNTDDLGGYEFAHLPPGTYFVAATAHVWYANTAHQLQDVFSGSSSAGPALNLDVVYPRIYYADATDSSAATPIPVHAGEHLRIDLHMQPVPAVHVTYDLPPSDHAQGLHAFTRPPVIYQSVFGERGSAGETVTHMEDHGKESLSISVAPGEYQMEVAGRTLAVNASNGAVLDPAAGTPSVEVDGKVAGAAGATLPDTVDILLEPTDAHGSETHSAVSHDGTFHFEQVRAGGYQLEAAAAGQTMTIVQAAASGAQLAGHILQVGTQNVSLAATLAPASAMVLGFAHAAGSTQEGEKPASGAMIVMVPQQLAERTLYRRDQSDSDGSFTLGQVAVGRYTLVAIADGWDLEWARPEVIARYLPGGQQIIVSTGTETLHLSKPAIVQAR